MIKSLYLSLPESGKNESKKFICKKLTGHHWDRWHLLSWVS
ncbi:Uncharacterized protein dnl_60270 [Desulfonema limicola]|uniref:Uncharacterized protein n=1 Tax=Desulfonema limicola TaxID=45656 RepID=A0A975BDF4_9BACT|nr:Uncharacterized protein dnl_60270 [Desulfonema limicola]